MGFQIHALNAENFAHLFELTDEELRAKNACRMVVDESPGTPCRVSMADAEIGDTVVLTNYCHQPANSPYQSNHAIFIRKGEAAAQLSKNEVPEVLRTRLVSVRLFDVEDMIVDAEVVEGTELDQTLTKAFDNDAVSYVHLHYAKPGCFAASVTRAG